MQLEQHQQAMLQLHLSLQHFSLLNNVLYQMFIGVTIYDIQYRSLGVFYQYNVAILYITLYIRYFLLFFFSKSMRPGDK